MWVQSQNIHKNYFLSQFTLSLNSSIFSGWLRSRACSWPIRSLELNQTINLKNTFTWSGQSTDLWLVPDPNSTKECRSKNLPFQTKRRYSLHLDNEIAEDEFQCLEFCQANPNCTWFSFYPGQQHCQILVGNMNSFTFNFFMKRFIVVPSTFEVG